MSLYVILLLLAIQGLALSCCEGKSDELISGEGPWKEDDWSGNSASSTGENDELSGYDSGSSANNKDHNSENPWRSPIISRTFSNKKFVTSGDGEDSSGSREDYGSKSNSHGRKDQGSANQEFDSIMGLAKIGDAIDVMKKLKKAKSDEELVKKLKSGPENLGVAFKTFEQLSGLWISVMHRIWRVWKAKGAKVVMHSIVDNLMNNTGRAITQKVGDFLRTKIGTVKDPNEARGSATFKDEGSTQPETTRRSNTLHNKTDIPLEKVSINFIKNMSHKAQKQHEKTWPSNKSVKATIEKVKVSFTSRNMNDSTRMQTPKHTSHQSKNESSLAEKITLDSTNINATDRSEKSFKTANSSSSNVSNVETATSSEHPMKTHERLESEDNKNTGNVSLGDGGNKVEGNRDTGRVRHVTRDKERTPKVTQHVDKKANVTVVSLDTQTKNNRLMSNSLKLQKADSQVKNTSSDKHANSIDQNVKMEGLHGNVNNSLLKMNATEEKVVISEEANAAKDMTEKSRVLEKLKINFLEKKEKNNRSHLNQNSSHATQVDALKVQKKTESFMQNETNSKPDSKENTVELSKTSQSTENGTKGTSLLDKVVLRLDKTDAIRNRTKEQFRNKKFENNATTSATTSAKSEKIVVNFYGKKETHKDDKTNTFVNVARGTSKGHRNATDNSSKNNKVKKTSLSRGVVNLPQEENRIKQKGGSLNMTNPSDERDRMLTQNNVAGNSTQLLDKGVAKARVQVEHVNRVADDSRNLKDDSVDASMTKTPNANRGLLTNKKTQEVEENTQKLEISDHSPTPAANIALVQKVNLTQKHVESQTSQKANGVHQEALKKDKPESERNISQDKSSTAVLTFSRNIKRARNTTTTSLRNTSTSITSAPSAKTVSGHSSKDTPGSPKHSTEISRKVHSLVESRVARKEKSEKSKADKKINTEVVSSGEVGMQIHHQKSGVTHSSGSAASHNTNSNVKHDTDSDTLHHSGSGSGMPQGVSASISEPESHTTNDLVNGVTRDPTHGVTKKQDRSNGLESSVTHVPNDGTLHHPDPHQKSKGVVIFGPHSDVKHEPESVSTKPSHVINITTERSTHARESHKLSSQLKVPSTRSTKKPVLTRKNNGRRHNTASSTEDKNEHVTKSKKQLKSKSVVQDPRRRKKEERPQNLKTLEHHIQRQDIARNDDNNERIQNESNSSRLVTTPQNVTNEDKNSSQYQQVDVLTSRTPPASLLTTSNDDNAYSIKEIVQGPRGSRLIDVHSDDRKIHSLERKVVKLENEVTVLETAMAGLANRLLVIEHKSEHPKPTTPAFLLPQKEGAPRHEHPIHSQQQTTVYIGSTAAPQIPTPPNAPEKIVIPISSLYPGGERRFSTHSASIHEVDDDLESKDKDVTAAPYIPAPLNGPQQIVIPISSLYPGGERRLRTHFASKHEVDDELESKDDSRSEGKLEDSTHEALPLGVRYVPTSEAHAVVRPIVNIIVPNNRADALSRGATCSPRCQNGGRCLDGNTCRCPTFFSGDHCERFSLRDLLERRALRTRPYRKVQRVVLSESPDQHDLDGTFRLDSEVPALDNRDLNLSQDIEPEKAYVAKQQPVDISSPSNSANAQGATRRRQLILEI